LDPFLLVWILKSLLNVLQWSLLVVWEASPERSSDLFIVGEVYAFGIMLKPELAIAFIFMVMAVVLIISTLGIFGRPER